MRSKRYPPISTPYSKPLKQPLVHPSYVDPSCVLALFPQRDPKWFDYSGNSNHGTLTGASFKSTGRFGVALSFSDSAHLVNCGNNSVLDITDDLTFEFWANLVDAGGGGFGHVFFKLDCYRVYVATNGQLSLGLTNVTNTDFQTSAASLIYGSWMHCVITRIKTTGVIAYYINGLPVSGESPGGTEAIPTNANDLFIGNWGTETRNINGLLDFIALYTRSFSPIEVFNLFQIGRIF